MNERIPCSRCSDTRKVYPDQFRWVVADIPPSDDPRVPCPECSAEALNE